MIKYRLSQKAPHDPFLQIEVYIKSSKATLEMKLPEWRPGRYQLGNFSKYLRNFKVYNTYNQSLDYRKTNKNSWQIECQQQECIIQYEIYTSTIDGGSTFVDQEHWYLNFINCMLYNPDEMNISHEVEIMVPGDWTIVSSLKRHEKKLIAKSFYELVDSPVLAGLNLQHIQYNVKGSDFHLWFRGEVDLQNRKQLTSDFEKFTALQIDTMGEFESTDYHFLFQIPNDKAYHGVEHLSSTCIVLGPAKEFNTDEFYNNLLGISSHELFHYWNIIRIRPKEMYPYDFNNENYFSTGYVAEGVTTYYGDLFLIRSGVKDLKWYLNELNLLFKRHFENYGRFNASLAESSLDLWVDGYEKGIPDRKVSIYVKGALIALILDLRIIIASEGEKSLDDVMRNLWQLCYKKDKGYSPSDYLTIAETVIGQDLNDYSRMYIEGCTPLEEELSKLLSRLGFKMELKSNQNLLTHHFGFKTNERNITDIAPGSPAEKVLRIGDEIISLNNIKFEEITRKELFADDSESFNVHFLRNSKLQEVKIAMQNDKFYSTYFIEENEYSSASENALRKKWLIND